MRTEAVANPGLLRRWEMLTDVVGRPVINGNDQPLTPVDPTLAGFDPCLLYTSDAADERSSVDLGGRRIIKKKTYRACIVCCYQKLL